MRCEAGSDFCTLLSSPDYGGTGGVTGIVQVAFAPSQSSALCSCPLEDKCCHPESRC